MILTRPMPRVSYIHPPTSSPLLSSPGHKFTPCHLISDARQTSHAIPKCHQSHHLGSRDLSISTLDLPSFHSPPHVHLPRPHLASPPFSPPRIGRSTRQTLPCAYRLTVVRLSHALTCSVSRDHLHPAYSSSGLPEQHLNPLNGICYTSPSRVSLLSRRASWLFALSSITLILPTLYERSNPPVCDYLPFGRPFTTHRRHVTRRCT
ncbi:hypothetical protein EDB86DRAFT_1882654 [Lactarius hatsudake]|nr:hypothetical protein EDB86DRAFT_1882654 [Lactarius hatsudake]